MRYDVYLELKSKFPQKEYEKAIIEISSFLRNVVNKPGSISVSEVRNTSNSKLLKVSASNVTAGNVFEIEYNLDSGGMSIVISDRLNKLFCYKDGKFNMIEAKPNGSYNCPKGIYEEKGSIVENSDGSYKLVVSKSVYDDETFDYVIRRNSDGKSILDYYMFSEPCEITAFDMAGIAGDYSETEEINFSNPADFYSIIGREYVNRENMERDLSSKLYNIESDSSLEM